MGTRDRRVDAYIAKSEQFARPILRHIRAVVHAACPKVEETIKWGMPHFMYRGILGSMAAFKQHAALGFWTFERRAAQVAGATKTMGQFGRIVSLRDLPTRRTLAALVRRAMRLNEAGVKSPMRSRARRRPPPRVPADLRAALARSQKARATYAALSPSGKRDYVEWITGAKRAETRARRLARSVAMLARGKPHTWQYSKR